MHACVCGTCYVHVLVYVCLCVNIIVTSNTPWPGVWCIGLTLTNPVAPFSGASSSAVDIGSECCFNGETGILLSSPSGCNPEGSV